VNRLRYHAIVLPWLAVAACGPSPESSPPPDARGCSDWPTRPADGFVSLDGASMFEVESFLVAQSSDLAIAWEAYGCDDITRVGYVRRGPSGEMGKPGYLSSPNGQMASNVTVAFDDAGSLFAAWASWTPGPDRAQPHVGVSDIHIQLARWPADRDGFGAPVGLDEPIADALYDKPWVIVTEDDAVIVGYSDLRRGGIWTAASADGGASFRRVLVDSAMANLPALCPDGRPGGAFITYVAANVIRVAHTTDGGATWSPALDVARSDSSGAVAYQDPMCVARGEDVWVSYGRTFDSYDTPVVRLLRVQVAHLRAGTVASDVVALDAAGSTAESTAFVLFPQFTEGPAGTLALAAYRASDEGAGAAELVYVVSADGGLSFGSATTLADHLTPSRRRHVPDWLGDYFGWAPAAAGIGAAFIDNASGFSHVVLDENVLASGGASSN
jgi:hypothetical protein